ncbi:MAG: cell division protein ZapA [Eubacteriales bacterium]|nr:cell division protein ZapA [Eubacteriales bacterium]
MTLNNKMAETEVLIAGKVYKLAGADAEHLQRVAALLNAKILEVKNIPGYKNLDHDYKELLMNINLADEYFKVRDEADRLKAEAEAKENELYTARHDLVSMKLKLENALKQQNVLERRAEEWKTKYEALKEGQL